jgi:adenine nucleotide transporter 17
MLAGSTPVLQSPEPPCLPLSLPSPLSQLVRIGGWQALFSGLEASLIGTTISQGVYFYLYSLLRRLAVIRRAAAEVSASGGRQLLTDADIRGANVTVADSLLVAALAGMGNVLLTK